jgi:16S rRNA (guanine(966)-N(2))-methyltransferase RsmD
VPRGKVSSIRIIAGRWKGRRLAVPGGARPTSDRAREALFSILQKRIPGAKVLDLYSGSGAVGLEAFSRGAARAVLVEKSGQGLRANLARLPPPHEGIEILAEDAGSALRSLAGKGARFDLVFADPPYGDRAAALRAGAQTVLAPGGIFVFQGDRGQAEPEPFDGLALVERRDYGRNVFFFFSRDPDARPSKLPPL